MATAAEVLRIGPFNGGLNLSSDPSSIADNELRECVNLELDIDGSLKTRPPYMLYETASDEAALTLESFIIIGSGIFAGIGYIFASGITPAGTQAIRYSTNGTTWVNIKTGTFSKSCAQYHDKMWFVPDPDATGDGGSWDPVGGWTDVSGIPNGSSSVIHKERLYVVPGPAAAANSSRLYFSDPADPTTFDPGSIIDVSPGDGQSLNEVIVVSDNLMLFKDSSIHVLAYDLNPADAILREINPVLGVRAPYNVVQYENVVYILSNSMTYEVVNYEFSPINIKVPFSVDQSIPSGSVARTINTHLSIVGDRLLVSFYNKVYVFGLRTRTWSEWRVTNIDNMEPLADRFHVTTPFVLIPSSTLGEKIYYSLRNFDGDAYILSMNDSYITSYNELGSHTIGDDEAVINGYMRTKDYDMADPIHYKRLFWWSADVLCGRALTAKVNPVQQTFDPIWDLLDYPWDDLGTWGSLVDSPLGVTTEFEEDGRYFLNKTLKFLKSLRFRKVNFELTVRSQGTSTDGPAKIFSLTATIRTKQTVVKGVN